MKTVLFYSPHCGLRGTEVTMFDFADYNEKILGNKSIIAYNRDEPINHPDAIRKFNDRFDTVIDLPISSKVESTKINQHLNDAIEKVGASHFYLQKLGFNDGVCPTACKTCILCCTLLNPDEHRHGDRYAFISPWLSKVCSGGKTPVVPSIVYLPDIQGDMREELGIPKNAIVFGRSGGEDTWNIPWTNKVIEQMLIIRPDIYFLFQNTPNVPKHDRIIHVPASADMTLKVKFINTCDAMLHSRFEGESFGVSCGEFSIRNKRVITYGQARERNHIETLRDKGIYFNSPEELYTILATFKPDHTQDWNCYRDYEPEPVMRIFDKEFLSA